MSPRKSPLVALIARDVLLTLRHGVDSLMVIVFFVLVVVLFPLGLGPEPTILARISPGVIWVAALLAAMLSMERLFQNDHSDGSLELLVLSPVPLELQFLAKAAAHWLTTGLPLIIVAPLLGIFLNMPAGGYTVLLISLALGTPSLSLIGGVGAALSLGARRSGILLSLLVLPLFIPVLIFGVSAIDSSVSGLEAKAQLLILGGFTLASVALAPWAGAAALRQAV